MCDFNCDVAIALAITTAVCEGTLSKRHFKELHCFHIAEDELAIRDVDISFLPDKVWSESTNRVDFTITVINQADREIPVGPIPDEPDASYSVELYFSKDSNFKSVPFT